MRATRVSRTSICGVQRSDDKALAVGETALREDFLAAEQEGLAHKAVVAFINSCADRFQGREDFQGAKQACARVAEECRNSLSVGRSHPRHHM
jgi:hypothetical protein